jgi:hypothetical protein
MSDRPILFSSPMILALLAGRKAQTRRVLKDQETWERVGEKILRRWPNQKSGTPHKIGDRLWVRESLNAFLTHGAEHQTCHYPADHTAVPAPPSRPRDASGRALWAWQRQSIPSIHCPRWASRLTLTVTDVRVQLLQEISEEDAIAEGWPPPVDPIGGGPINWFARLWNEINGPQAWHDNPFVACYSFEVRKGNIDA